MKSLRQLSEEEQREARIVEAHRVFMQQMAAIEADYQRNVERNRKFHRRLMLAITILAGLGMVLPALAVAWRLL